MSDDLISKLLSLALWCTNPLAEEQGVDLEYTARIASEAAKALRAVVTERDEALNRVTVLEDELECAAELLQQSLPIGDYKAIGLREVAAAVRFLVCERDEARDELLANTVPEPAIDKLRDERDEAREAMWKWRLATFSGQHRGCGCVACVELEAFICRMYKSNE